MQKMMGSFDGGRQLADGTDRGEGFISFIEVVIISAKPTNVFGDPEI